MRGTMRLHMCNFRNARRALNTPSLLSRRLRCRSFPPTIAKPMKLPRGAPDRLLKTLSRASRAIAAVSFQLKASRPIQIRAVAKATGLTEAIGTAAAGGVAAIGTAPFQGNRDRGKVARTEIVIAAAFHNQARTRPRVIFNPNRILRSLARTVTARAQCSGTTINP